MYSKFPVAFSSESGARHSVTRVSDPSATVVSVPAAEASKCMTGVVTRAEESMATGAPMATEPFQTDTLGGVGWKSSPYSPACGL